MYNGRNGRRLELFLICALLFVVVVQFSTSFSQGPNNRNVSVDTRVNVTGSVPEILLILVQDPITLGAGSLTEVSCNISIRDFNGFADLDTVNATLHSSSVSHFAPEDNNTHYTNSSCSPIAGEQSGNLANYTCTFQLNYYAVDGSWNCTAGVNDTINLQTVNTNTTTINTLLALNVTTLIDYGDLAMGSFSDNETANVTNLGNVPINVSVQGYGQTPGDNLSFVCDQGNLTVDLQHFAPNSSADFSDKQNLTGQLSMIGGLLTVPKAINGTEVLNTTYWELFLNTAQNAFGLCNGTIVFQAESST